MLSNLDIHINIAFHVTSALSSLVQHFVEEVLELINSVIIENILLPSYD